MKTEQKTNRSIRRQTFISFGVLIVGFALGVFGWRSINNQPKEYGQPKPFRTVLKMNEKVNREFFSTAHLSKEFPKSAAVKKPRVNGDIGMGDDSNPATWKLSVNRHKGEQSDSVFQIDMNAIKDLPKREVIFDFKCIEGWSEVTHWSGARFSDFLKKYHLGTHSGKSPDLSHPEDLYKYAGLVTPDGKYYVGIDMKSMMQSQTILCYEMNAQPLPDNQGYPLRLIITVKYGIKSLKRIGYIFFSDTPPADYWHEQGYDYDAAL